MKRRTSKGHYAALADKYVATFFDLETNGAASCSLFKICLDLS
jgi:hypothetical protein